MWLVCLDSVSVNRRREGPSWIMTTSRLRSRPSWLASCVTISKAMLLRAANGPHAGRHNLDVLVNTTHPILADCFRIESSRLRHHRAIHLEGYVANTEHCTTRLKSLYAFYFRKRKITFARCIVRIAHCRFASSVILNVKHLAELVFLPEAIFHG